MRKRYARRNPTDLERALAGDKNLSATNLEGADLRGLDLSAAIIQTSNLKNADLQNANLRGVDLSLSNLSGANLRNADLRDAVFAMTKLIGADLRGVDLRGASLVMDVNLSGAKLQGAQLQGARLSGAKLSEADLTGADLTGANLTNTDFTDAVLTDAILDGTILAPLPEFWRLPTPPTSAEFKRWFGKSKVVDAQGQPLRVLHGTRRGGFKAFDATKIDPHQPGFYFTDNVSLAQTYGGYQYALYLRIERPYVFDAKGAEWNALVTSEFPTVRKTYEVAEKVKEAGYDGIIFLNIRDSADPNKYNDPSTVFVVFDPTQIKSATHNRGTWDREDPILYHNPRRARRRSRSR